MIACDAFYRELAGQGVGYFTGVPDSLLKDFGACVATTAGPAGHVTAANEGAALALASGYHLATGKIALVYLQNSGLGNLVNPLTSLTDPEVYAIPVLLLVGWRGEPGVADEPQHRKQGRVTQALLDALEVPHAILPDELAAAREVLATAVATARRTNAPYALLVRKGTFAPFRGTPVAPGGPALGREEALGVLLDALAADEIVVATTGMASREVYELRKLRGTGHARDFLTVGSMGHASQIALGLAGQKPGREVWCLDGDGAALMHLGALATIGGSGAANFRHVILNNGVHDSVGGQPTAGSRVDFPALATACGYRWTGRVDEAGGIGRALREMKAVAGPALLEVRIRPGARADLGRPTMSPQDNKREFMAYVRG